MTRQSFCPVLCSNLASLWTYRLWLAKMVDFKFIEETVSDFLWTVFRNFDAPSSLKEKLFLASFDDLVFSLATSIIAKYRSMCLSTYANKTVIHRLNSAIPSITFIKWLPCSRSKRNGAVCSCSIGEHNHKRLRPFPPGLMFTPKNIINIYLFVNFSRWR